jgi:acyl-CoA-binding protein
MSALQDRFAQAQEDVNALAERPDNNTMLKLYALYKQATQGDATGERPGGFDFVRAAKFDAWSEISTSTWLPPFGAETAPSLMG